MYSFNSTFPIHLFFKNDILIFSSAIDLKSQVEDFCKTETFEADFKKIILELDGNTVGSFVEFFPFIFHNDNNFEILEKDVNQKKCSKEIIRVINKKFDLQQLSSYTNSILKDTTIENFNEEYFYSQITIFIYKIFFVEISKNINFFFDNTFNEKLPLDLKKSVKKYMDYEKELLTMEYTEETFDSRKNYVINFRKALNPVNNLDIYDKILNLYHFTQHQDKNLILYQIITKSIIFRVGTSTTKKNKVYRQIFKIIAEYYFAFDNSFDISKFSNDDKYYVNWFKKLKKK
jgi:hypothetical protein